MRTSSQLSGTYACKYHNKANVSTSRDAITLASAQKQICIRMMMGEPIDDIRGELDNILTGKGFKFENKAQRSVNLATYVARIKKFMEYAGTMRELDFPDRDEEEKNTIDFYGENVTTRPDFTYKDELSGNRVICRLKTGRRRSEQDDLQNYETYALGKWGEKNFPGENIVVQYCHLADASDFAERQNFNRPFNDSRSAKTSSIEFNEEAKAFFDKKKSEEKEEACTPDQCASCNMNNICHFEEPPISINIEKEVKPINEIRLTNEQRNVVNFEEGIARINAGAGAGKTLVIAMRVVELLRKGYEPEDICLLTFTKAGAEEMTARVVQYCAGFGVLFDPAKFTSTTFNAFCQNLISEHHAELGYREPMRVIPDETRSGIINRIIDSFPNIAEWDYSMASNYNKTFQKYHTKSALNSAKQIFAEIKKEGYTQENNPYTQYSSEDVAIIFQMYEEYNKQLKEKCLIEYDDQILLTFELAKIHPEIWNELGYKHIIVDEFQDTDLPQIELLNQIMDNHNFKSFMAVGDDSQSIFSFRHTSPEYMINFNEYFGTGTVDFNLVENHRSNKATIDYANKINTLNVNRVDKDLIATKPLGKLPVMEGFYSQKQEYEYIAKQIKERIDAGQTPSDIAFLACDRNELIAMASVLTELGIPSVMMNPIPYVQNSRVAAICTFFKSFLQNTDQGFMDYKNALMHGALKGAKAEELEAVVREFKAEIQGAGKGMGAFMKYAKALDEEQVDECYQDFLDRLSFCRSMDELTEFFRDFDLYGQDSCFKREGKYEGVCLTTVHSAKGLEWDTTFLSLSHFDRKEYHRASSQNREQIEETNRKWFVGATRAREELIVTGQYIMKTPSLKADLVKNDFVEKSFELTDKVYNYSPATFYTTLNEESEKEQKKNAELRAIHLDKKKGSSKTADASKILERLRMGRLAKDQKVAEYKPVSVSIRGEMTEAEKKEYDEMVKNSTQMTVSDLLKKEEEPEEIEFI